MERAAALRRWEALHDEKSGQWHDGTLESWHTSRTDQYPYHRDDGVNIWVSPTDLSPNDKFLSGDGIPLDEDPGAGSNQPGA